MNSVNDIKAALENFKKDYIAATETNNIIAEIIKIYEAYLASPISFSPETKAYFLTQFTEELIKTLKTSAVLVTTEYKKDVKMLLGLLMDTALAELETENSDFFRCIVPLFDPHIHLYKSTLVDLYNRTMQKYAPSVDEEWRVGLKEGDGLDLLKTEVKTMGKVEGWMRGKVRRVEDNALYCSFDGYPDSGLREFHRSSRMISPLGSRTDSWEWREQLKKGDRVDALDTQHKWYLATVLDSKVNPDETKELLIGYRFYTPDGSKTENTKERFEGWRNTYDVWINQYSVCIQPPNLIAKYGGIYCRVALDHDASLVDDSNDVLEHYPVVGDKLYVIHRYPTCQSSTYLELINQFGSKGGFRRIIELVPKLKSLEYLFVLIELMASPASLYHRLFVRSEIKQFLEEVYNYIQNLAGENLEWLKKEKIEAILTTIEELANRVYTRKANCEVALQLKVNLAICLLKTEKLETRIQAVRMIGDSCKASGLFYEGAVHHNKSEDQTLTHALKVPQFIEEVFGKRSHIQLVQRSTEILKYILLYGKITEIEFNVIWECCEQDEQSKVEIFKVISDSSHLLSSELIGFIIRKFAAVPLDLLKNQDVDLICELAKYYRSPDPEIMQEILEIMWKIINGEEVSAEAREKLMRCFCGAITMANRVSEELMKDYYRKCYEMIKERTNPILAYKILMTSMEQMPILTEHDTKSEMINSLLQKGEVFDHFFIDLEAATVEAKNKIASNSFNDQVHKEETLVRRKFMLFWLKNSNYKFNKSNLEVLWKNWVQENIAEDQITFYNFLKKIICYKSSSSFTSLDDLKDFFIQSICNEENDFQNLPAEGIKAIRILLITVNKAMGKLVEVEYSNRLSFGFNHNMGFRSNFQDDKDIEFRVLVPPSEIVGLSILWKIILEAKGEFIIVKAMELINELHINLSEELKDQIAEISSNFIETAMEKLRLRHQRMAGSDSSGEVVKVLRVIEDMIEESERKGNGGITPLMAFNKGQPLLLRLRNLYDGLVIYSRDNFPVYSNIEINVHSKVTLWQLKMLIANKVKVSVESIQLSLSGRDITDKDHGKTLLELKFENGDLIHITKRDDEIATKVSLLEGKKLSKKAIEALTEIFERFGNNGTITCEEYAEFTAACFRAPIVRSDDSRIRAVFKQFKAEDRGYLTLEEFLTFYEDAAIAKEDIVWNNLRALGYGSDLIRIGQARKNESMKQMDKKRLPRYLLANSEDYMTLLFSLIGIVLLMW